MEHATHAPFFILKIRSLKYLQQCGYMIHPGDLNVEGSPIFSAFVYAG